LPFRVSDCRHEAGLIAPIPHLIIISDDTARHCPGSPFPFPFPFPSTSFSSLPATHHQLAPPVQSNQSKRNQKSRSDPRHQAKDTSSIPLIITNLAWREINIHTPQAYFIYEKHSHRTLSLSLSLAILRTYLFHILLVHIYPQNV
jgi:hypothetical protein